MIAVELGRHVVLVNLDRIYEVQHRCSIVAASHPYAAIGPPSTEPLYSVSSCEQALYDLMNQTFEILKGERFCRISLGTYTTKRYERDVP